MQQHILVVEDNKAAAAFVQTTLEMAGFAVVHVVDNGTAALARIETDPPDLILLDLVLPGASGFDVCRAVRRRELYIPIIMLTGQADIENKVAGLELGADDYVTKPFGARELIARVHAVLRLASRARGSGGRIEINDLIIERGQRSVTVRGQAVNLVRKEFDLLVALASERGRVFEREELLKLVWGYDYAGESRTVDVHMQRLRQKIELDPANPRYLITVHGVGYKFAET